METTGMNSHRTPRGCRQTERGVSMIEFLMAAFIFSIGLLGLAALQVTSTRQGLTSRQLGTATFLAHNLLDQIQAEGAVANAERILASDGSISATRAAQFTYIKPDDGAAMTTVTAGPSYTILGLLTDDPYYKALEDQKIDVDKTVIFTTSWIRNAGFVYPYAKSGIQEFTVNVTWSEYNPQTPSTPSTKAFSVSRYVRM